MGEQLDYIQLKQDYKHASEDGTQVNIEYTLFSKDLIRMEEKYKRDICLFNKQQILETLAEFGSASKSSLASKLSIINKYIDYAIERGYVSTFINNATTITYEDLNSCVNKLALQDKVIFL